MKKLSILLATLLLASVPFVLADEVSVTTSVDSYLTATFEYSDLAFATLTQGSSDNVPTPSFTTGMYNVTIDTNHEWKVSALGTNFTDGGSYGFGIENLKMDTNTVKGSLSLGSAIALSEDSQELATDQSESATADYHGFWLSIPASQYATDYTSTVTVTYAST
jgi:hypothetical protein